MKFFGSAVLAVTIPLLLGAPPALSATITSITGKDGHITIQIKGQLVPGDADIFMRDLAQSKAAGKPVDRVELNSTGGKLVEGANMAAAIKLGKLATSVGSGAVCASACFLAFAAGSPKFVGPGALIGVHKASDTGGHETATSGDATHAMAHFARELGVPSWIIDRMVATSPREIAWLEPNDLKSMGATTTGQVQKMSIAPRQEAASLADLTPTAANALTWNDFIDVAVRLSAEQNDGKAALSRVCQPELKNCIVSVAYRLKDGRQRFAAVIQDLSGKTLRREVCEFNDGDDQRLCMEWDTGTKHRDARNSNGDWVRIADQ